MMKRKGFMSFFLLSALVFILSACGNSEEEVAKLNELGFAFPVLDKSDLGDNIVADYEGGEITGEEFARFLAVQAFLNPETPINEDEFRTQVIQQLVMEKILGELVEDTDWAMEQTENIWNQLEMMYGQDILEEGYEVLKLSKEEIQKAITQMYTVELFFREQVTGEEILEFYNEVTEELTTASFTHILIASGEVGEEGETRSEEEALAIANELYNRLQNGEDMNELAADYTDDFGSVETGGRYEDTFVVELVPEFKTALLEQELDAIGEPVRTDYGYHIIRVEDIQVVPLEEIEEAILSEVMYRKYLEYYMETLPGLITKVSL